MNNDGTRVDVNDPAGSFYGIQGKDISGLNLTSDDENAHATSLKISHCSNITGHSLQIPSANETSVDIDVCNGVDIEGEFGLGPISSQTPVRIKGGCKNVKVAGMVHGHGLRWGIDVEIGDWMDQSYALSRSIDVSGLESATGEKLTVAIGWAVPFSVKLGPGLRYMPLASLGLKAYFIAKFIVRFLWRVPKGVKGPSWFP